MTDQMTVADLAANNVALVHEVHELQRQVAELELLLRNTRGRLEVIENREGGAERQVAILQAGIAYAYKELESIVVGIEGTLKEAGS